MSSHQQVVIGNLQLFGKIILKHFITIQRDFHHSYNQNSTATLSLSYSSTSSTSTAKSKILNYPSSTSLISSILATLSTSLTFYLVPELLESVHIHYSSYEHRRNHTRTSFPTSSCSSPQVRTLSPGTLHKYATTYTPPITANPDDDMPKTKPEELKVPDTIKTYQDPDSPRFQYAVSSTTYEDMDPATTESATMPSSNARLTKTQPRIPDSSPALSVPNTSTEKSIFSMMFSSINTKTLFFPGTCNRSAYLVFLPDPTSDLVLDLGPLIESTFKEYMEEELFFDEDDEFADVFNVYLYEEDELEMERLKKERTFSWKITIPRPPDSPALPRPKFLPGQERELGKGWRSRRQGQWHGQGHYCLGGKAWDISMEYGLRHWIASLNEPTSVRQNQVVRVGNAQGEWMRSETFETEPRIASIVRSINRLDSLVPS